MAVGIGFILYLALRPGSELDRGLVALNESYQERPVEVRLSDFKYVPMPNQRGEAPRGDYVKRELAGSRLRTAATESPSAASLRALGQWYLTERKFDEAIDQFNKALALDPNDAKSHVNLGAALLEKGKLDVGKTEGGRSVENFSRSLEQLNKGLQLDNSLPEGYFNRALVYQYLMLPREAEAAWREYLQKDPNSQWAEEAKGHLKRLEESNNRKAMTVDDTLKEFRKARRAGDDDTAWKLVSQHYTSAGNEVSNRLLDSFLNLSPGDTPESSLSDLAYLADLEKKQTDDRFTSNLVQRYSQATPAVRNGLANARRRANTAYALFTQSEYEEAIREYTAAKQEYEDAGDLIGRTFILYRLAHCDVLRGKLATAKQSLQQLIRICEANGYHWLVGQCLYSLAHAYADNNEFSEAISYSSRGLDKFNKLQDLNGEVKALTQLAAISQFVYRERNALDYLSQGLALTAERPVEPMQQWGFFVQAGLSVDAMQLYDAALLFQKRALDIALEMGRPLMIQRSRGELGFAYAALKMYSEALAEATKAFEVGSSLPHGREFMANASWQLGDILRESGQCDKAIDAYNRSIDLYRDLNFELYDYVAHKGRLLCLARTGDNNAIGNELTKVLNLFEEFRSKITTEGQRNSFFAVEQSVYDLAIDYEFQRKTDPIKAFEYSEVSRARTLLDAVSGSTSVRRTSYGLDLEISTRNRPLNLKEIQKQMPDASQILQYAVLDNKLFIWVITKSEIKPEVIDITASALTDKVRSI